MKERTLAVAGLFTVGCLLAGGAAQAQVDLSGNWAPAEGFVQLVPNGPPPGDFLGVPLNPDGRAMAATADPNNESEELNRQCQNWLVDYFLDGPAGFEIRPIVDPLDGDNVLAWQLSGWIDRPTLTIWVDGHAPPSSRALHTWGGFATGRWQGDTLAVSITHLSDGWMLRNGAPQSDQATVSLSLAREGNLLTEIFILRDPVYLSEPWPRAKTFRLTDNSPTNGTGTVNDCLPAQVLPGISDGYHAARYLPGAKDNPARTYMAKDYGVPQRVALGGAQQMYPSYQKVVRKLYKRPQGYCQENCGGPRRPRQPPARAAPATQQQPAPVGRAD